MKISAKIAICCGLSTSFFAFNALASEDSVKADVRKAEESVLTKTYDILDKNVLEISFNKGSANLSEGDRVKLRSLVKSAREDGKIGKVVVAAYADKAYRDTANNTYTDAEKDLAKKRADNLEKALDEMDAGDVTTYNMAEKPNWFEKNLETDEAKVKQAAKGSQTEQKDSEGQRLTAIGKTLKKEGGASKAVVIIEHAQVAH